MSLGRVTYLYCDSGRADCPQSGEPYTADSDRFYTGADQRRDAHAEGWHVNLPGGQDACGVCWERRVTPGGDEPAETKP